MSNSHGMKGSLLFTPKEKYIIINSEKYIAKWKMRHKLVYYVTLLMNVVIKFFLLDLIFAERHSALNKQRISIQHIPLIHKHVIIYAVKKKLSVFWSAHVLFVLKNYTGNDSIIPISHSHLIYCWCLCVSQVKKLYFRKISHKFVKNLNFLVFQGPNADSFVYLF